MDAESSTSRKRTREELSEDSEEEEERRRNSSHVTIDQVLEEHFKDEFGISDNDFDPMDPAYIEFRRALKKEKNLNISDLPKIKRRSIGSGRSPPRSSNKVLRGPPPLLQTVRRKKIENAAQRLLEQEQIAATLPRNDQGAFSFAVTA
jgi:hypothetical protein